MANPTSAFGWQMPTSTDLVTDLPADFEVFGQAVDTSLADLKGGTTGQVLSKATNADMDFTWVTTDDANAIQNSIVDAKGDLIAASANDTPARLAVGNNGETLVADSSTSTGLRYQVGNGLAQGAINGGFDVWQRGTSFSAPNYCADRWYANGGSATYAQEATAANLPTGFRYGLKMTMSATNVPFVLQAIETSNAIYYAGQRVILSFYVSSSASSSAKVGLDYSTAQDVGVTGTWTALSAASGFSITQSTTTSMTRVFCAFDVPSTAQSLRINVGSIVNITSGNSMTITGIQLELGSVPTQFRRAGGTIQGELAACQRYLPAFRGEYSPLNGWFTSTTNGNWVYNFAVPARVAPTGITISAVGDFQLVNKAIAAVSPTAITWNYGGTSTASVSTTHTAGSPTSAQGEVGFLRASTSSAFILFTGCEL